MGSNQVTLTVELNLNGDSEELVKTRLQNILNHSMAPRNPEVMVYGACRYVNGGCDIHKFAGNPYTVGTWAIVGSQKNAHGLTTGGGVLEWHSSKKNALESLRGLQECAFLFDLHIEDLKDEWENPPKSIIGD